MYLTSNDGSQNKFIYQPTLDTLELNKVRGTDYAPSWKWNGVYNAKLKPLYTAFLHSIKLSRYKMRIKLNKDPLSVEQNIYLTEIENVYFVCDLAAWPKILLKNFALKNC